MKNTSSLFLTLVSYLIMLTAILFLLFAAMPLPLKAQTNADMVATNTAATNAAVTNVTAPATTTMPPVPPAPPAPAFHMDRDNGLSLGNTVVAIMPFIFSVAIIAIVYSFKYRRNKLEHETVRMMIEKGQPATPEIIAALKGKSIWDKAGGRTGGKTGLLLAGLILAGIGIGVIAAVGKQGLIVLLIGAAFLVVWFVEGRKSNDQQPPKA